MKTATVVLPSYLASALINGDVTGLENRDMPEYEAALALLEEYPGGSYVDVGDSYMSRSNDLPGPSLLTDVAEFTILYRDDDEEEGVTDPGPFALPTYDDPDGFEEIVEGYLDTALFTGTADSDDERNGEPLDRYYDKDDFSDEAREVAEKDVAAFIRTVNKDSRWQVLHDELEDRGLELEPGAEGFDLKQIGNDIWYSMNGHGVGFWDRPELYGKRTAEIFDDAAGRHERYVYEGDGELHIS